MLCDVVDDSTNELAAHAPRSILRKQISLAQELNHFVPIAASELEYFLYKESYEQAKVNLLAGVRREPYRYNVAADQYICIVYGQAEHCFKVASREHEKLTCLQVSYKCG